MESNSMNTVFILGIIILCGISVLLFVWLKLRSQNQGDVNQFMAEPRPIPVQTPQNEAFDSVDEKLKKLKELLASNLISEQDYERMKAEILEGTFRPTPASVLTTHSIQISNSDTAQIISFLRANQKIEAIKLFRERTNLGLKEAKDAVEAIERQLLG
jgi:ribosomal protein L7/L12